jgi:hypothetical protein
MTGLANWELEERICTLETQLSALVDDCEIGFGELEALKHDYYMIAQNPASTEAERTKVRLKMLDDYLDGSD